MAKIIRGRFDLFAEWIADHLGKPMAFAVALGLVVTWALAGPLFGFSDTWQLLVNTITTISTFLMVFLLQNTQNRDTQEADDLLREIRDNQRALLDAQRRLSERITRIEYQLDR